MIGRLLGSRICRDLGRWERTRWFVIIALPSEDLIESGSLPGYELGVWRVKDVRGGDVKSTFSRGKRTKDWGPSSMTQFMDMLLVFAEVEDPSRRSWVCGGAVPVSVW